jgi:hypothetical protein
MQIPFHATAGWQESFAEILAKKEPAKKEPAKKRTWQEKKRTRGWGTTGPVAALEVWVFGGGEQPLKRSVGVLRGAGARLKKPYTTIAGMSTPDENFSVWPRQQRPVGCVSPCFGVFFRGRGSGHFSARRRNR